MTRKKKKASTRGTKPSGHKRGTVKSRRAARRVATAILKATADSTAREGAAGLGLVTHDVKNLRAGNMPGLPLVLRLVRDGRISPGPLFATGVLRKLPGGRSVGGAQQKKITARVRKICKAADAATLAKASGLSIFHIYQLRVGDKPAGLHTVLAFMDAGHTANELFFGG